MIARRAAWSALALLAIGAAAALRTYAIGSQVVIDDEWHALHKLMRADKPAMFEISCVDLPDGASLQLTLSDTEAAAFKRAAVDPPAPWMAVEDAIDAEVRETLDALPWPLWGDDAPRRYAVTPAEAALLPEVREGARDDGVPADAASTAATIAAPTARCAARS